MARPQPRWFTHARIRKTLPASIGLAVLGTFAMLVVHTLQVIDPTTAWGLLGLIAIPGVFVVWVPTVIEAIRMNGDADTTDTSRVLRGLPSRVRVVAWCVAGYVVITTTWMIARTGSSVVPVPFGDAPPSWIQLVPLVFFGTATLVLISARHTPADTAEAERTQPDAPRS